MAIIVPVVTMMGEVPVTVYMEMLSAPDPGCRTLSNGDPGWPGCGGEWSVCDVQDERGNSLPRPPKGWEGDLDMDELCSVADKAYMDGRLP